MIEYLQYRAKLTQLFRQKERLSADFTEKIRKAQKAGKPTEDIQSLENDWYFGEHCIDEEIASLATDNLIRKARRWFVPISSYDADGMWKRCDTINNRYVLTNQGISQLSSSLRKEHKERAELLVMVLSVLIGIVGAATGLVAVIMK